MDYPNIDKEDYDKLLTSDPRIIQSRIIDFIIYYKDTRHLLPSKIRGNVAAIKLVNSKVFLPRAVLKAIVNVL